MENLPHGYWDEVRQHTAELLTDPFERYRTFYGLGHEGRRFGWPGDEARQCVMLLEQRFRLLGAITVHRSLSLNISERADEVAVTRSIEFSPRRQRIEEVEHGLLAIGENVADDMPGFRQWMRDRDQAEQHGLLKPADEDYMLLIDQLRRGVEYRRLRLED